MHYSAANTEPVEKPEGLAVGDYIQFTDDRFWWEVRALTENFAALTRRRPFSKPSDDETLYTVADWRTGVRGPCNLIGQGWGDGTYSSEECQVMLKDFESGEIEVSQRNWVHIRIRNFKKGKIHG